MPMVLPVALVWLSAFSLAVLTVLLWGSYRSLTFLYYGTLCLLGILAFHGQRGPRLRAWLQALPLPALPRAILLGYAAVVAEETLVGLLHGLAEGGSVPVIGERIGQFIAFNLLAFTGSILGLTLATRALPGLARWHLLIAGGWGLFAERTWLLALENPIAGALIAGPTVAVYSVILAPLVLSLPGHDRAGGRGQRPWAPLAAWALMLALSVPPVGLLMSLRASHPQAFPPCDYIPCN